MGKGRHPAKSSQTDMSRKQKRKMLRKQKKQRRVAFHQKKSIDRTELKTAMKLGKNNIMGGDKRKNLIAEKANKQISLKASLTKSQNDQKTKQLTKPNKQQQKKKKTKQELQNQAQILREQKEIEYYEKLLGVNKNKGKYKGIAKGLGYEDDLFDFLDGISKRIKQGTSVKGQQQQQEYGNNDDFDMQDEQVQQEYSDQMQNEQDYDDENEQQQYDGQQYEMDEQDQDLENIDQQQGESYDQQDGQQQQQQEGDQQQENDYDNEADQIMQDQFVQQFGDQQGEQQLDDQQLDMWNSLGNEIVHEKKKGNKKQNKTQLLDRKSKDVSNKVEPKNKLKQPTTQTLSKTQQNTQGRRPLFGNMTQQQKQQLEIRKQMNAIFNKLSDGNLMISFRQFSQIFISAPKSSTIPVFIDLFRRFNVEVEKPHLHILLSNIALASALHHLMGNRLMAPLAYELIKSFGQYEDTPQNYEEIEQIGYSKLFEKKKNLILIFSYLYHFGSLTGEFIHSLVKYLSQSLNEHNVEFLYIIIQKIGSKIRQNDPGVLKNIIETLRESIQKFKSLNQQNGQLSKINIIETQLNEIKFNRKVQLFSDQRMAFFATFLSKNIPKQLNTEKQVFLPNFQQIKNANISTTTWWQNLQHSNNNNGKGQFEENQEDIEMINEITTERKKLIELAKSLNLVTQIRKNIFVQVMQSSDYLQAAQRVLALRIKNLHQIAVVLIQTCILEPTFNPYYPLVAAKIANINPKFKSKVQFTIWDQIKLLESYDVRKTSNLAKFTARFVGNSLTDGSLSILKYFPDLINVHPYEAMFLMIFFTEFLSVAKKQTLAQMSSKLKQASNSSIKDSILEYLKQVGVREKGFNNMDKMKFLRRMIMINDKQDQDGERF